MTVPGNSEIQDITTRAILEASVRTALADEDCLSQRLRHAESATRRRHWERAALGEPGDAPRINRLTAVTLLLGLGTTTTASLYRIGISPVGMPTVWMSLGLSVPFMIATAAAAAILQARRAAYRRLVANISRAEAQIKEAQSHVAETEKQLAEVRGYLQSLLAQLDPPKPASLPWRADRAG